MKSSSNSSTKPAALLNAHPSHGLVKIVRKLSALKERSKMNFTRNELCIKLGCSPTSGAANPVISAFIHYGLLEKNDIIYSYTELANKLLLANPGSDIYHELIQQAFVDPELYKHLYTRYGTDLPDEIESILLGEYCSRVAQEGTSGEFGFRCRFRGYDAYVETNTNRQGQPKIDIYYGPNGPFGPGHHHAVALRSSPFEFVADNLR